MWLQIYDKYTEPKAKYLFKYKSQRVKSWAFDYVTYGV